MPRISIVTSCYDEVDNIEAWYARVISALEREWEQDYEIIVADNGSGDGTAELLRGLAARDTRLKVILNSKNFGVVRSGYNAFLQAQGEAVILLASDLQDPPELINEFLAHWRAGRKVVMAVKTKTEEGILIGWLRGAYYRLLRQMSGLDIVQGATGFGLYDRAVVETLRQFDDFPPFFRGMVSEVAYDIAVVPFDKPARTGGKTSYSFLRYVDEGLLGITNHSRLPLRLAMITGFIASCASLLVGLVYLVYKLLYWDRFSVGQAPLVIGMSLLSSVQLFFLGVIGEYIGAIFTQVRKRPLVGERERINF